MNILFPFKKYTKQNKKRTVTETKHLQVGRGARSFFSASNFGGPSAAAKPAMVPLVGQGGDRGDWRERCPNHA